MYETDPENSEVIELVVQPCIRIGMMMEDVSPLALNASHDGLELRIAEVAGAIRVMVTIADAAEALLWR